MRYKRFSIGSTEEHEIIAAAPCCVEEFQFVIEDVAGNIRRVRASQKDAKIARILSIAQPICIILVVLIAIISIAAFLHLRKKKYGIYGLRRGTSRPSPVRRLSYSRTDASRNSAANVKSGTNEDANASMLQRDKKGPPYENTM